MKKSLIALAVAGAMTAPVVAQADATLYGNVEIEGIFAEDQDAEIQVDDARMGVKGSDETYIDGVSSFYQIELEYNPSSVVNDGAGVTVRKANAGLTGGFGTVIGGRFTNPSESTEILDVYSESVSTDYFVKSPDRLGSSVAYITPSFGGFSAYAGLAADGASGNGAHDNQDDREDLDGYVVGADYAAGGFTAAVTYWEMDGEGDVIGGPGSNADDMEFAAVALSYAFGNFTVSGSYAETENYLDGAWAGNLAFAQADTETWALGAEYALENTTFGVTYYDYTEEDVNSSADVDADEWGVYVSHKLSNKASVKAQFSDADVEKRLGAARTFVVGYNVSF